MSIVLYNPESKTVTVGEDEYTFFCGKQLDDLAHILILVRSGEMSVQEAWINLQKH